jgi:hypothetical protein
MAVIPEERDAFRKQFRKASEDQGGRCCDFLFQTPITAITKAFGCEPFQLRSAADMFPGSRTESAKFLNKLYIMDVILKRATLPAVTGDNMKGKTDYGKSIKVDCDVICPFILYKPEHHGPEMDYLYRAAILLLPQCGAFFCYRGEQCRGDVDMPGTLTAHELSCLCLQREELSPQTNCEVSNTFGVDSFVRRFFSKLIVDLAILGCRCFTQVYSVIRDTEGNSGLLPVPPMLDGDALLTESEELGGERQTTGVAETF